MSCTHSPAASRSVSPGRVRTRARRSSYSNLTHPPVTSRFGNEAPRSRRASTVTYATFDASADVVLSPDMPQSWAEELRAKLSKLGGVLGDALPFKGRAGSPDTHLPSDLPHFSFIGSPVLGQPNDLALPQDRTLDSPLSVSTEGYSAVPASLQEAVNMANAMHAVATTSVYHEHAYWVEDIEGKIPEGLRGTLLRNGPAQYDFAGDNAHPLEGDGMVYSFNFDGEGGVWFNNKFVRTEGFVEERKEGVQRFRNIFNSKVPDNEVMQTLELPLLGRVQIANPADAKFKDSANVNVLHWGGKNVAVFERCTPHLLSDDLDTLGTSTLDGSLKEDFVGAHHRIVTEKDGSRRLVMFGSDNLSNMKDSEVIICEYDEEFKLLERTSIIIPDGAFGMYHDITVTDNYYVLIQNRMKVDYMKLLSALTLGTGNLFESFAQLDGLATKVHLIPRPGKAAAGTEMKTYEVPGGALSCFHQSNGFEINPDGSTPDGSKGEIGDFMVLDILGAKKMDFATGEALTSPEHFGDLACRTDPHRLVLNLKDPAAPVKRTRLAERLTELPTLHPAHVGRPQTHAYFCTSSVEGGQFWGNQQGVCKISTSPLNGVTSEFNFKDYKESFWFPDSKHQFAYEPIFVPRQGGSGAEDDGYVLVQLMDVETKKPQLVILDAQNLEEGPVARIKLSHHLCPGLHGMWTSDYMGPPKGTPSRPARDIREGI